MVALGLAVERFQSVVDHMLDEDENASDFEPALLGTGLVRCRAGHALAPPRDDCAECVLIRLGSRAVTRTRIRRHVPHMPAAICGWGCLRTKHSITIRSAGCRPPV
jgi:hypothetical protein